MGIVTTTSETAFTQSAETVYDFVTNPQNWTKTYPGSAHIGKLPELPLKVGDTWEEAGPDGDRVFSWQLAAAVRPTLFVFTSIGRLGHDRAGGIFQGGMEGRITVSYRFTRPGQDITLFSRTMTIEAYKHAPLPDQLFLQANPAKIDAYHEAVARELARSAD
ncbi:SRPBCC family protein [Mycobacterium colombiense]|uniref:Polyketide cyclase n=1 Tax=Mycobacterium colombiense TaxID=339268 RepID=A0A853LUR8_9MYCO|nr:SRPBCC family protein [Mycobacterium colombiense]OBJ07204.1 polyketide cyclase [Mycobacterium colombiense]OBJ57397.1 polyketide cyclase [Mycobacterium colombiense]